ncbi:MAG: divergent polysaccharide deacetylase family protein [Pseudomonadota bacterium]
MGENEIQAKAASAQSATVNAAEGNAAEANSVQADEMRDAAGPGEQSPIPAAKARQSSGAGRFFMGILSGSILSAGALITLNEALPLPQMLPGIDSTDVRPLEEPVAETAVPSAAAEEQSAVLQPQAKPESEVVQPEQSTLAEAELAETESAVNLAETEPAVEDEAEIGGDAQELAGSEPSPVDTGLTTAEEIVVLDPGTPEPTEVEGGSDTSSVEQTSDEEGSEEELTKEGVTEEDIKEEDDAAESTTELDPALAAPVAEEAPTQAEEDAPDPVVAQNETEGDSFEIAALPAEPLPELPDEPALERNAVAFAPPDDLPLISVILEAHEPVADRVEMDQILELNLPLNLALVPEGSQTRGLGERAKAAGFEVLAHLPMEPRGAADPGPDALTVEMNAEAAAARTRVLLARLPDAVAASNFMGSKATEDAALMRAVIGELERHGMAFVDSQTSRRSRAYDVAEEIGAFRARNSRFVPADVTEEQAYRMLERAAAEARQRGGTVLIGPASRSMLLGIQRWALERNGRQARLAPISAILRAGGGR